MATELIKKNHVLHCTFRPIIDKKYTASEKVIKTLAPLTAS